VQAAIQAARKDCGIHKHLTVHSLRHAYATHRPSTPFLRPSQLPPLPTPRKSAMA
jgi:site-specific recombinase XerC